MTTESEMERHPITRGVIVLDYDVGSLDGFLTARNIITVLRSSKFTSAEFLSSILPGRLFVTNKGDAFVRDASSFCYGIIDISELPWNSKKKELRAIADRISHAITENRLWDRRHGFLLKLQRDGNHEYRLLID